ncbi:hypothetical protein [Bradyrhizobium sp.]|uniref:hypothetical protein n=1 Tax=Bradyrhizobium sp. TaxID=376 RepID=UPI0023A3EA21|nr:hypothetical protein [Bradyrhizobium sp.]MDE1933204.1 hypothetical protein [Bradyrhizobium sp.]
MTAFPADPAEQLSTEKALLVKADSDIEQGWARLRNQQLLLSELRASGHDSRQAERLVQLLQQTLVEWERHRALIAERVNYLERQFCPENLRQG